LARMENFLFFSNIFLHHLNQILDLQMAPIHLQQK
jgi:hypothetical protein